nr:PREDICTED: uncharacterized protein LOC109035352 [Bemisia tabaci]
MAQRKQPEKSEESSGFGFAAILGAAALGGAVTYGLTQLLSDNSSSGGAREAAYQRANEPCQRRASSERQRTFPSDFSFGTDQSGGRTDDPDLKTACGICWNKRPEIMMLPCNHVNLCRDCWEQFRASQNGKNCITCRGEIRRIQRVYV